MSSESDHEITDDVKENADDPEPMKLDQIQNETNYKNWNEIVDTSS